MGLNERSRQIRRDIISLSKENGFYHYGGSFSCIEILVVLFDHVMGLDDRFILSKGHAAPALYVLLREFGLNPKLEGHPKRDPANGIHFTTGSGGHGFPAAIGMCLAKKMKGEPGCVYVLIGDGECQEGTTWESMLIAARLELDNLTVIVDWNGIQGSGRVKDILPIKDLSSVAVLLGWDTIAVDGHNMEKLHNCLKNRSLLRNVINGKPKLVVAKTVKGKGVSFMEDAPEWHARWMDEIQERQALEELA